MSTDPKSYTASQIARAVGAKRQAVQRLLRNIQPSATPAIIAGQSVKTWPKAALPESLRCKLNERANAAGYRTVEDLIMSPPGPPIQVWPPFPLTEVAPASLEYATKLQRALQRALAMQNDPSIAAQDVNQAALQDYEREFGYPVTIRHLNRLMEDVRERAG